MSLRIALVTPEYPGCGPSYGVGAYLSSMASGLVAAGAAVRVLACSDDGVWHVDPGDPPLRLATGRVPFALRPLARRAMLQRLLRGWHPDVVEVPNWGGLGAVLRGPWRLVVRWSTPTRLIREVRPLRRMLKPLHHAWESAAVARADVIIADSCAMAAIGRRVYGRRADAIIAHGWAGGCEPIVGANQQVLYVGRIEYRKGIDILLAAWALVRRRAPHAVLHLVGADADGFATRCLATSGADGVVLHGRLADDALAALRRGCGLQVVPSRFESFGMVVLEAWAAGQAVIACEAGALAEVVGGAGLLVPRGDSRALAEAMAALLADPQRTCALARSGQARLRATYAQDALARANLAVYGGAAGA